MKKYKLIKEYPGSPKLGCTPNYNAPYYWYGSYRFPKELLESNPEFWEEVIEIPEYVKCTHNKGTLSDKLEIGKVYKVDLKKSIKDRLFLVDYDYIGIYKGLNPSTTVKYDYYSSFIPSTKEEYDNQFKNYEILSFIGNGTAFKNKDVIVTREKGKYSFFAGSVYNDKEKNFLNNGYWNIHSIKRLSDGEVFTIGDKVDSTISDLGRPTELTGFKIDNNKILFGLRHLGYYPLGTILKVKKPLFKTEDGVDIYDTNNIAAYVSKHLSLSTRFSRDIEVIKVSANSGGKYFSTLKAAEAYLVLNKPCLSFDDIRACINMKSSNSLEQRILEVIKFRLGIQP